VFVAAILVLALIFHVGFSDKAVAFGPTLLTTTGIFATFLWIAVGLSNFDTRDIQTSLPALLDGIKLAFWASVVGVGGALTLKLRHYFARDSANQGTGQDGDITASDLLSQLKGIQQALVGNEESTLVSQIKLSRQDMNDKLDALKRAQEEALTKLSEMGSKALVEALRDVIKDFNAKITEQFGDNFRQLNHAVGQLLVWQDAYKEQLELSALRHQEMTGAMMEATSHYSELLTHAGGFTRTAEDLGSLLKALEGQKNQMVTLLKSLGELLHSASGSLPLIEQKVLQLTEQLSNSVATNQKEVGRALTESTQLIRASIQAVGTDFTKVNGEFNKQLGELAAKTKEQVAVLDAALSEELKKSLDGLGRQLTALSERFVADYTPLTERLRQVVQLARV
jgi:hypothetical protein